MAKKQENKAVESNTTETETAALAAPETFESVLTALLKKGNGIALIKPRSNEVSGKIVADLIVDGETLAEVRVDNDTVVVQSHNL